MFNLTPEPSASLQLHLVPAGRRLDFDMVPSCFAYVYRRQHQHAWQCVARNACSPYFDRSSLSDDSQPEYVVCYCDAAGTIKAATSIAATPPVAATPAPHTA
ncbi:hypothetical protein [Hymenobacter sp.]|jgi:hypothetical protein|uniref:hypothetical protein n=1 Tax=Hymenobacter sp. TaxID=1898978 RepID=UPI002ED7A0E7